MRAQLAGDLAKQEQILIFKDHKTAHVYGPLKKWVPLGTQEALRLYQSLPLPADRKYFICTHTEAAGMVCCVHLLTSACKTLGHPGACPGTNYIRKLYHSYVSSSGGQLCEKYDDAMKDLAELDAHSYKMATSLHYDVSDMLNGPIVKKSVRAFWTLNEHLPVFMPPDEMTREEWEALMGNLSKRGNYKRAAHEMEDPAIDELPEGAENAEAAEYQQECGPAKKKRKIHEYAQEFLEWWGEERHVDWHYHQIAEDLWWNEGLAVSYLSARYYLKGK